MTIPLTAERSTTELSVQLKTGQKAKRDCFIALPTELFRINRKLDSNQ